MDFTLIRFRLWTAPNVRTMIQCALASNNPTISQFFHMLLLAKHLIGQCGLCNNTFISSQYSKELNVPL
jgi:hypothetical protein